MKSKNNLILYILIGITGFALFAPVILDIKESFSYQDEDKQVEIFGSTVTGYQDGKLSWKIFSDYIWTGRSKYLFRAEGVNHGILLDTNGDIVVDSLFADFIKVNTKSKTLTGYDHVSARFLKHKETPAYGIIASDDDEEDSIKIQSDELRYFSVSKRTYLYENVQITQGKAIIKPTKGVEVDNDTNIAYIDGGFYMVSDEFEVAADNMRIFIDDDYSIIEDQIQVKRIGRVTTNMTLDERERQLREKDVTLTCESMFYSSADDNDQVRVTGNIYIVQDGKELRADTGFYNRSTGYYELSGSVSIKLDSLDWLISEETKSNFNNDDIIDAIHMGMNIEADKLIFDSENKELKFVGNVKLTQSDKEIYCKELTYYDADQTVQLEGFVRVIKEGEDKIETEFLELNLKTEEFHAKSGVLTEFKLKKQSSDEP